MNVRPVAIIPARYASTRLPGKALAMLDGRPMICHVAERTRRARSIERVLVATDDDRIRAAVEPLGIEVVMTRADHPSGTDRLAEVAASLGNEILINVQGDLPLVDPDMIDTLAERLAGDPSLPMATLATPIQSDEEFRSPHVVKVVTNAAGRAMYFSRAAIPHDRDGRPSPSARVPLGWRHVGMYGYRRDALLRLAALPPSPFEQREKLEQLRALENGIAIGIVEWTVQEPLVEVDTSEDLERARLALRGRAA